MSVDRCDWMSMEDAVDEEDTVVHTAHILGVKWSCDKLANTKIKQFLYQCVAEGRCASRNIFTSQSLIVDPGEWHTSTSWKLTQSGGELTTQPSSLTPLVDISGTSR